MKFNFLILILLLFSSSLLSQWRSSAGPEGIAISCVANLEGKIYAGTQAHGLYVSSDDGQNWIALNSGIEDFEVTSVIKKDNILLVGTFGHGVYRSNDDGIT